MKKLFSVSVVVVVVFVFAIGVQAERDKDDWDSLCGKSPSGVIEYACMLRDQVSDLTLLLADTQAELSALKLPLGITNAWGEPFPSLRTCYNQDHDLFELHMKNESRSVFMPGFIALEQKSLDGSTEWINLGFFDADEVKVHLSLDEAQDSTAWKFSDGEWKLAGWYSLSVDDFVNKYNWVCPNNTW